MDNFTHQDLTLFDLLSPEPIMLHGIGSIRKPTNREISRLQFLNYTIYLNMIGMSAKELINLMCMEDVIGSLSMDAQNQITFFELFYIDPNLVNTYLDIFNFFIIGNVIYNSKKNIFEVYTKIDDEETITGYITRDNFQSLFSLILRINYIKLSNFDTSKIKSKKALELIKKIEKHRAKKKEKNNNMDYGNVISKVSTYCNGVNMINVWDMTTYQTYNRFYEQFSKNFNDIKATNYAFNGGDKYDFEEWMKKLEE